MQAEPNALNVPGMDSLNRRDRILIAALFFCTVALFFRTANFEFVAFDDQLYVYSNPHVIKGLSLETLRWAMTAAPNGNWHPLTTLVQLTISTCFGINAGAYHLVNVILHALNVALLYVFFRRTTRLVWPAFFAAALWGLHPLRIESVAWVAELKDVLCGSFWLGCMLAYLHYARNRTIPAYLLVLLLHVLSLLSKPMAVTLPMALLLLDYWPLSQSRLGDAKESAARWWTFRVVEKLPLLAFSIADISAQQNASSFSSNLMRLSLSIRNGIVSTAWYLSDLFFPHHLAVFYPHPMMTGQGVPIFGLLLSTGLILFVSALVVLYARTRPYLCVGWFWFLGTLVPVIGLIQVGEQARADRFTYLPSIGIVLAVVWLIRDLAATRRFFQFSAAAAGFTAIAALVIASTFSLGRWRNTDALFGSLLRFQPTNYMAMSHRSEELFRQGDKDEALRLAKRATEIAPLNSDSHAQYATLLWSCGQLTEAQKEFRLAIDRSPTVGEYWDGIGAVRDSQANQSALTHDPAEAGLRNQAIGDFRNAVKLKPDFVQAREHLAFQLALVGKIDEAIPIWEQAVDLLPSYAQAQGDLADALRLKDQIPAAIEHYRAALADGSKNPDWETNLAWLIATSPQATPAEVQPMIAIAKDACDQTSNLKVAPLDAYAACLARVGRIDDAKTAAQQAIAQAYAAHEPTIAQAIQRRLVRYGQGLSYVAGDDDPTVGSQKLSSPRIGPATAP